MLCFFQKKKLQINLAQEGLKELQNLLFHFSALWNDIKLIYTTIGFAVQ